MGDPFTLAGTTLQLDDTIRRNGQSMGLVAESLDATARARIASIASLSLVPRPFAFPRVELTVQARDAAGDPVEGLPAAAFAVSEGDDACSFSLQSVQRAPSILVLVDTSGSMPPEFKPPLAIAMANQLREQIVARYPAAQVTIRESDSSLWTNLSDAAAGDANLIVYLTDGDFNDKATPSREETIRNGPPIILIGAVGERENYEAKLREKVLKIRRSAMLRKLERLDAITNGPLLLNANVDETREAVLEYVTEHDEDWAPYTIVFTAPTDAPGPHEVTLRLMGSDVRGQARYEAPPKERRHPLTTFLRLEVSVTVGGRKPVRRTLAGWQGDRHVPPTAADRWAVHGAFFGRHVMLLEKDAPQMGVFADEHITEALARVGIEEALDDPEVETGSLLEGPLDRRVPPLELARLPYVHLPDDGTTGFQQGLRGVLVSTRPDIAAKAVVRSADLLPLGERVALHEDPRVALRRNLVATAAVAIFESELFPISTRARLRETSLVPIGEVAKGAWARDNPLRAMFTAANGATRDGTASLVDAAGVVGAWWRVSPGGHLTGMLDDGTGGGREEQIAEIKERFNDLERIIDLYTLSAGLLFGGVTFVLAAAYGKFLARLGAMATLAVLTLDAEQMEDEVRRLLITMACEISLDLAFMGLRFLPRAAKEGPVRDGLESAYELADHANNAVNAGNAVMGTSPMVTCKDFSRAL